MEMTRYIWKAAQWFLVDWNVLWLDLWLLKMLENLRESDNEYCFLNCSKSVLIPGLGYKKHILNIFHG